MWPGSRRAWPRCATHRRTPRTATCARCAFTSSANPAGAARRTQWTPWPGDPRVNIQKSKGGKAKPYQVRQVLKAIDKLNEEQT
ncbi:MAG: hypothetical protein CL424_09395 [Acidimicrobiaceae bacterium]|nr:hypothetical protein [Acidimicrobiaceae bacterium]